MYPVGCELSVPEKFYRHVAAYIGGGMVFHNHPIRGEEIVSVAVFSKGREVTITKPGVRDITAFLSRVRSSARNPGKYSWFYNNCEHTVSRLRTGNAESPQLRRWTSVGGFLMVATALALRSA